MMVVESKWSSDTFNMEVIQEGPLWFPETF